MSLPPLLPSPRLLWATAGLLALALAAAVLPMIGTAWAVAAAAFALVALLDAAAGLRQTPPEVARAVPNSLALGVRVEVALRAANHSASRVRCELNDLHPASFECDGLPQDLALAPGDRSPQPGPVAHGARVADQQHLPPLLG